MLKKDQVIELYKKYGSKRKVAQELQVTRQYVIQVIRDYESKKESV
jgi:DNA invertase Pin-like site-specific DNA recombinase